MAAQNTDNGNNNHQLNKCKNRFWFLSAFFHVISP